MPGTVRIIQVEALTGVAAAILAANGLPAEDARYCAECLVEADLRGVSSHGVARLPVYARRLREGVLNPAPKLTVTERMPVAAHVDGDNGIGFVVARKAMDIAIEKAAIYGVGLAAASRSNHYGMSSLYVNRALDAGLASFVFTNAAPTMPVWGGRDPFLGTNPLAMGAPGATPFVLDMATSVAAKGKVRRALAKGETIPEGWALDADGNPTTDAKAALAGTMVPLGDAKGTALALMVELLCAGLTGANYAYEQSSFFDAEGAPPATGQLLIAIDPQAFGTGSLSRFAEMAGLVAGMDGARLPGSRRQAIRERLRRDGIPADAALVIEIEQIAAG